MQQRNRTSVPDCAPCPPWCTAHTQSYRWDWDFTQPTGEPRRHAGSRLCTTTAGEVTDLPGERVSVGLARIETFDSTTGAHDLRPPRIVIGGQLHLSLPQAHRLAMLLSDALTATQSRPMAEVA